MRLIGYEIYTTARKISKYLTEYMKEYDLTLGQWTVIRILLNEDMICQRELANRCEKDQNNIRAILDKLESKNLIVRVEDVKDRRVFKIVLTQKAKELSTEVEMVYKDAIKGITKGMTEDEIEILLKLLDKVKTNIELKDE